MIKVFAMLILSTQLVAQAQVMNCRERISNVREALRQNDYDCNTMGREQSCLNVCHEIDRNAVIPAGCSPMELERAARDAEQRTLHQVRNDLRATGYTEASVLAGSNQECLDRAQAQAQSQERQAVDSCNSQIRYAEFRRCAVVGSEVSVQPHVVGPIAGESRVVMTKMEYESRPGVCEAQAEGDASNNAINNCRQRYGVPCEISSPATRATVEQDRRGIIRREDIRICKSYASAKPIASSSIACTVRVTAKNQF